MLVNIVLIFPSPLCINQGYETRKGRKFCRGIPRFSLEDGPLSGSLAVTISKVTGAKTYGYEYTLDPLTDASQWNSEIDNSVKHVFADLESGKKYWIRVVAYGSDEQETDSDPVSRIVQ